MLRTACVFGLLVLVCGSASAQLTDQQLHAAQALGESGHARDGVKICTSVKMKEGFRHPGLAIVQMRISGPAGDVAMKAQDAKRLYRPLELTDDMKAWHLTVMAQPQTFGMIQALAVRGATGESAPADTFVAGPPLQGRIDAIGVFSGPAARAIIDRGDFQIVAVLPAGERSCDMSAQELAKLGF